MEDTKPVPVQTEPIPWYDVWQTVLAHPKGQGFERISRDSGASPWRAVGWVAWVGLAFSVINLAVSLDVGRLDAAIPRLFWGGLSAALIPAALLALNAALYRLVGRWFKGRGSFRALVCGLGAVQAPLMLFASLVGYLLSFLLIGSPASLVTVLDSSADPGGEVIVIALALLLLILAMFVYALVLHVQAVRVIEDLGVGKAVLVVLLALAALTVMTGCLGVFTIPFLASSL